MKKKWTGERLETFVFGNSTIEHLHRYAVAREMIAHKRVLDIACGEGYGSNLLSQTALQVDGVDIDQATVEKAQQKYRRNNLSFKQGSVINIPFEAGIFDVVVSFETLEHIAEHDQMLAEIKRVLKPDGQLIISTPEKKFYSDIPAYNNPFHKKELYENQFAALLKGHFLHFSLFYQNVYTTSLLMQQNQEPLKVYEGNFSETKQLPQIEPMYLFAICSDADIPAMSPSIFLGKDTLETAILQKEKDIKGSLSYKIGHTLLLPLKLIRHLFVKNTD